MFRLLKGFGITLNYFTKKNITIQYPEEKVNMPERFRGIQRFFPDKCIVCDLCVKICPTDVITLTGKKDKDNPKKKIIDTYNIDFQGCILCDFCTEVCPTDAIVMTARYDNLSEFNRAAHFKDITWLTDNHEPGNYTEPDPEAEAQEKAAKEAKAKAKAEARANQAKTTEKTEATEPATQSRAQVKATPKQDEAASTKPAPQADANEAKTKIIPSTTEKEAVEGKKEPELPAEGAKETKHETNEASSKFDELPLKSDEGQEERGDKP